MKKGIFVYNSLSGNRRISGKIDYIFRKFQLSDILLQPYSFCGPDDDRILQLFKNEKYDFLLVSGGDGTINYAANLILKNNLDIPLGLIPAGTCNDFARSLKIPLSVKECVDIVINGKTRKVDVGLINGNRYFLNTCAGGQFVDVSFSTNNELKRNLGQLAYYLKAVTEVANVKNHRLKVQTENSVIVEDVLLFLIVNGKDAAGLTNIVSDADVSDGLMDILLIKSCKHIDMAGLLIKALRNESLNDRNVIKLTANRCVIEGDKDISLSIDGEKGDGLPIEVKFLNQALDVFVR